MTDIINELSHASAEVQQLRRARHDAQDNAQLSFSALLEPAEPGEFSYTERYAVAAFTAAIYQASEAADFYFDLLEDEADEDLVAAVRAASQRGVPPARTTRVISLSSAIPPRKPRWARA